MSDIELMCDSGIQHYNNAMEHANLNLIKKARLLFNLCRSKHMSRLLHTHLASSNKTGICKLNEVFCESRDAKEGWSPIITASAIFAFQRTEYTALSVESLENYLKSLLTQQSRDGGWPYSEKTSNTLSVFSTAIAIHALAVLIPAGWKQPATTASDWLKKRQNDFGLWSDIHADESPTALAVLVLDAINLADGKHDELTFQLDTLPMRKLRINRLEGDNSKNLLRSKKRGRKRKYSDTTTRKALAVYEKSYESTGNSKLSWQKAADECGMPSRDAAKMIVTRYRNKSDSSTRT